MATKRIGNITLNYSVPEAQTQLYNAIGRTTGVDSSSNRGGGDNFFVKKGKSIENAIGTTLAAPISLGKDIAENIATDTMRAGFKSSIDDIYKKYGFKGRNDYYDKLDAAESAGDQTEVDRLLNLPGLGEDLRAQANKNASEATAKAKNYEDYRNNSYVGQKINQDRGKFLGSAINTMSTATDVLGLSNGPLTNAIQGGVEGIADELEQNGLENFDWGRAGQNALIGAASGAVTGALNKGISNSLAKRAAAKGLTNTVAKNGIGNAIKQGVKTVAGGAARGALSGAVGGATGAGLQSALNGVDLGQGVMNTLQGAVQGAKSGATTGGIMAGANAAINKTPGIGTFLKNVNQAQQDWKNSGSNFDERLTNTLTSGDSAVGDWLMNKRQSKVLGTMGNLGNSVQDVSGETPDFDEYYKKQQETGVGGAYNDRSAVTEYANKKFPGIVESLDKEGYKPFVLAQETTDSGNTRGTVFVAKDNPYEHIVVEDDGTMWRSQDSPSRREYAMPPEWEKVGNYNPNTPTTANSVGENSKIQTSELENLVKEISAEYDKLYNRGNDALDDISLSNDLYDKAVKYKNVKNLITDLTGVRNDYFSSDREVAALVNVLERNGYINSNGRPTAALNNALKQEVPTTAGGWLKKAGQRIIEDANNHGVGMSVQDVSNDIPDDIRNMQIRDYNAYSDGDMTDGTVGYDVNNTVNHGRQMAQFAGLDPDKVSELAYIDLQNRGVDSDKLTSSQWAKEIDTSFRNVINESTTPAQDAYTQGRGSFSDALNEFIEQGGNIVRDRNGNLSLVSPQTTSIDPWDRLAQENGYRSYDDVVESYMRANPNANINQKGMAGAITTWMDNTPGDWNPNQTVKNPQTAVYEALTSDNEGIQEAQVVPSKTSRETKMRYAQGKELLAQYGAVDQPMARATKAPETFQKLAEMGFTKPQDVEKISNEITGSNGAVSTLNRNVIASAKPVNTFDGASEGQTMDDFIDNSIEHNMLSGTNQGKAVKRGINAYLKALPSHADGSVTFEDSAADTFKVVQSLEARAAELEGRGGSTYHRATTEDVHQAAVLKDVANLLKDRIYDGANVKVALTPAVSQSLKSLAPGNQAWSDTVDAFISSAKTPQDLRSFQKPFVRASRYIDNQYVQAATAGGRMAANAGELPSVLPVTKAGWAKQALNTVWNSNAAHRARANIYNKLANNAAERAATQTPSVETPVTDTPMATTATETPIVDAPTPTTTQTAKLASANTTNNPAMNIYNAIGRYEGNNQNEQARVADYLSKANTMAMAGNANTYSEMPYMSTPTATSAEPTASNVSLSALTTEVPTKTGTTSNVYFPETGDYWTDLLGRAMTSAINADDVTAFGQLYEMYQNALSQQSASSSKDYSNPTNWSSADRTKLLNAQNALDQIDQLEQAYVDATGEGGSNAIQGWLRSRAADISGGNWDPSASNYNSLAESIGMSIVKNLINLGVTEADAERYKKYIPSITDTKEQAATKLETLRQIYQNQINNLYGAYGL